VASSTPAVAVSTSEAETSGAGGVFTSSYLAGAASNATLRVGSGAVTSLSSSTPSAFTGAAASSFDGLKLAWTFVGWAVAMFWF
jgi:hypothetical protein